MWILVKICGKIKFWVNFSENVDFGKKKKNWKLDTGHSFRKKNNLGPKFSKIPIFVSIFGNDLDFGNKFFLKIMMLVKFILII